jgi:hypothetical protein
MLPPLLFSPLPPQIALVVGAIAVFINWRLPSPAASSSGGGGSKQSSPAAGAAGASPDAAVVAWRAPGEAASPPGGGGAAGNPQGAAGGGAGPRGGAQLHSRRPSDAGDGLAPSVAAAQPSSPPHPAPPGLPPVHPSAAGGGGGGARPSALLQRLPSMFGTPHARDVHHAFAWSGGGGGGLGGGGSGLPSPVAAMHAAVVIDGVRTGEAVPLAPLAAQLLHAWLLLYLVTAAMLLPSLVAWVKVVPGERGQVVVLP